MEGAPARSEKAQAHRIGLDCCELGTDAGGVTVFFVVEDRLVQEDKATVVRMILCSSREQAAHCAAEIAASTARLAGCKLVVPSVFSRR